ncbi:hypothetical protein [Streptomyces sp. MH60]|uniref:hypothetical protein n=1 Tax=Streptomyces sp. MH60 TaxID=1940758 RepID=UPI000CEEDAC7|nr:hypothetical protein [Streptomyces sp. MH60]PPS89450.1 hypothetical protein BZZ08_01596 [Streptomyces sp. MH60]
MAGLSKDMEPTPEADGSSDPVDPFRGDSYRFTWTRQVEVGQLQAEVTETLGPSVQVAAVIPIDEDGMPGPVSAEDPITFYVTPSSVDLAAVRRVLAEHRPDPYYGMSDEERAQAQLREKIAAGGQLTPDEMQMALRMLVA